MATTDHETIGSRVRRLRLAQGKSQRDLAVPGLSAAYISRVELGTRTPSAKAIRLLARRLGVRASYLETGADLDACEELELRLNAAALRAWMSCGDEGRNSLLTFLREAELLAEPGLIIEARVTLGLTAVMAGEFEVGIEFLQGAIESGAVSAATDPDVYEAVAVSYRALRDDASETSWIRVGDGLATSCPVHSAGLDGRVRRLKEVAEAAVEEGRYRNALRAQRMGLALVRLARIGALDAELTSEMT